MTLTPIKHRIEVLNINSEVFTKNNDLGDSNQGAFKNSYILFMNIFNRQNLK